MWLCSVAAENTGTEVRQCFVTYGASRGTLHKVCSAIRRIHECFQATNGFRLWINCLNFKVKLSYVRMFPLKIVIIIFLSLFLFSTKYTFGFNEWLRILNWFSCLWIVLRNCCIWSFGHLDNVLSIIIVALEVCSSASETCLGYWKPLNCLLAFLPLWKSKVSMRVMNLNAAYTALFQLGERVFGLNTGWSSQAIKVDKQWETWDLELLQGKISHGCMMNGIKVLELKAGRLGGNS